MGRFMIVSRMKKLQEYTEIAREYDVSFEINDFYEPEYTMVAGDLADKVSGKYDICIANIVADVIIRLCDNITDYIKPNGLFITSGIIDTRAQEVRETIEKTGFDIVEVYEEKGWVCMISKLRG